MNINEEFAQSAMAGGGICPFCGAEAPDVTGQELEGDLTIDSFECPTCEGEWSLLSKIFSLSYVDSEDKTSYVERKS